ncbi:MAG: MarR family transcriptional regulator [Myxococcales bacterium]|nr:MarR family transcriptional regulator [Myxococcales bacterium]
MKQSPTEDELASLLEALVNRVSHPRGRALAFLAKASLTVDQAILLHHAFNEPGSTPTRLGQRMNLSLPSVSQMIKRLEQAGMLRRVEDLADRRRKSILVTSKAKTFLARFRSVRIAEFAAATEGLSPAARHELATAIRAALDELGEDHDHQGSQP